MVPPMRNLLQDADRDRLVAPLAGPLLGEVELGGRRFRALAEAEGGARFPLEANALAAELLHLPGLHEAHAALADDLLDFVMAMAEAAPASRCSVTGRIALRSADPRAVDVANPFFCLAGDLSRGLLRQVPAGGGPALRHGGNLVEFRIGRHRACVDVEETILDAAVERRGERVVLRHVSAIRGLAGLVASRQVEAGRLAMEYEVAPDSPVLRVVARFTAARPLAALRLTTALDAVAEEGLDAGAARLLVGGAWRDAAPPTRPGAMRWAEGEAVAHVAVGAAGLPRGAPAAHLRPLAPARVASVTAEAREPGALHWLLLRHGPVRLGAGEVLAVEEDRLLAPGGEVEAVAARMASGVSGLDLDPAPPAGLALHAAAAALLHAPLPAARRAALEAFADRQAARVEAEAAGPAELAWAALGADSLRRARAAAEPLHARLVARLAALPDLATGLAAGPGEAPSLAIQSVALLALARAGTAGLARALEPISAGEAGLAFAGRAVDPMADPAGLALLARAAGAVPLAGAGLPEAVLARARALHRLAANALRPLVRPRDGALLVMPRGGGSPAIQALVTLGLLAPDRLAAERAPA